MKSFGLTEYQAKKTASTLMAMSNGMEINAQAGKIMSVNLTKLSADMASFYNVSQNIAETALQSVFTGETESLKKFGVVMTEANLNAFALSRGIQKVYSEMSQGEKVALRYQYVMNATSKAQGDFARTSGNWANQLRVLNGQWSQLISILGQGLIKILTPILGLLNQILASLIGIANAFAKIFGGTGISKVSMDLSSASVGAGDLSDNLDDAAGNAKKLEKTIAGFDELNVLKEPAGSGSGGASAGAGVGGLEVQDYYGNITDSEAQTASFNEILKTFNDNIKKYYDQIVAFGGQLGEKFNTAFKSIDWPLLGETVANGISLVYETANEFLTTVDWYGLGSSIADALNSGFDHANWEAIGENVANQLNAIGGVFAGFVDTVDWNGIGEGLRTRFLAAIRNINWDTIGGAIGTGITGAFTALNTFLTGDPIVELGDKISEFINSALMNFDATAAGEGIHNLTSQLIRAFEQIDWTLLAAKFREFLEALDIVGLVQDWLSAKSDTVGSLIAGFFDVPEGVADGIANVIVAIQTLASVVSFFIPSFGGFIEGWANLKIIFGDNIPIISSLGGLIGSLGGLFKATTGEVGLFKGVIDGVKTLLGEVGLKFANIGLKITEFFTVANHGSEGAKALASQLGFLSQNGSKLQLVGAKLNIGLSNLWGVMKAHPVAAVIAAIAACVTAVVKLWNTSEDFREFVHELYDKTIKPVIENIRKVIEDLWNNHIKPLWENSLKPLFESLKQAFGSLWDTISQVIGWVVGLLGGTFLSTFTNVFGSIVDFVGTSIGAVADFLNGLITFLTGVFTGNWSQAWEGIKMLLKGVWDAMVGIVKAPINIIIGLINGMIGGIVSGVNVAIRALNRLSIKVPDWVPGIGGKYFGFNISQLTAPKIPLLATGGVITEPTVAMMGEYPGANQNPEIVTPQNLLRETIDASNSGMIAAMYQMCQQMIAAIEDIDMSVSIGDETIAQSAARGNRAYYGRTGKPIFAIN